MPNQYSPSHRQPIYVIGPSIAYIPLTRGEFATVDWHNAKWLSVWNWILDRRPTKKTSYAIRSYRHGLPCRMHQLIFGGSADHINRNGLHNFRGNLRAASGVEQQRNRGMQINNTSGVKGVCPNYKSGGWIMYFRSGAVHLREYCATFEEAVALRKAAEQAHYGKFAPK